MVDGLETDALREVALLLEVRLMTLPTAEERRQEELGYLAGILSEPAAQGTAARSTPRRDYYDEHKPPTAPKSQGLCERYGSWTKACRAAGALVDPASGARAWSHGFTGRRRPPDYTRDEVIRAVLQCAATIGRFPSSNAYYKWSARRRREAKEKGASHRLPAQGSIERHFRSWRDVTTAVERAMEAT